MDKKNEIQQSAFNEVKNAIKKKNYFKEFIFKKFLKQSLHFNQRGRGLI